MIGIILAIAIVGVIVWAVTQFPMPPVFKTVIYAVCVIALLVYLASWLGYPIGRMGRLP